MKHASGEVQQAMDSWRFINERILSVLSKSFLGPFKSSSSGDWIVSWCDGGYENDRWKNGRLFLIDVTKNTVVELKKFQRPFTACVADNGSVGVIDSLTGEGLKGTFSVLDATGAQIYKKRFKSNLYNCGISPDGKHAVCQTAHNPEGKDGNQLTGVSIAEEKILFSINPEGGWAQEYQLSESSCEAKVKDKGSYFYDWNGRLLTFASSVNERS